MKQQSLPIGLIILIVSQAVFALIPLIRCVLRGEAANTNFIVYGLTRRGLAEPTIHLTRGEHSNHYTTDAISVLRIAAADHLKILLISLSLDFQIYFLFSISILAWRYGAEIIRVRVSPSLISTRLPFGIQCISSSFSYFLV